MLALASAGLILVYLGLAIAGWGGFDAFFANPARTALVIVTAVMAGAALFSSANLSTGEREDRSNRWVIGALGVIGLLSAWLPAYTDRKEFWTIDGDTVRWIGVVLYAAGGALRLWPVFVLGRRFSGLVAIQPGHTLVTDGIYRTIRNPSYLGLLALSLGWALAFRSLRGRAAGGAHDPAADRAHPLGRSAAALAIRRSVRRLLRPYVATVSRTLLDGSAARDVGAARGELLRHAIVAAIQVVEAVEGCFSRGPKSGKDEGRCRAHVGACDGGTVQSLDAPDPRRAAANGDVRAHLSQFVDMAEALLENVFGDRARPRGQQPAAPSSAPAGRLRSRDRGRS